jgi:hypothetical protein
MNPRWEILIERDDFAEFVKFLDEHNVGGFSGQNTGQSYVWILCYVPEELRVIAKLKFNITPFPQFGTEIPFTDCPTPS